MSEEMPSEMRVRILRELSAAQLPVKVGEDTPHEEMCAVNDMILNGWLEGSAMPHSRGWGFQTIKVVGIREGGLQALADSKPVARAKRSIARVWFVVAGAVAFIGVVLGVLASWRKLQEPLPASPSPTPIVAGSASPAPATPAQSQSPPAAPSAQQPPSASTPTPATPKP